MQLSPPSALSPWRARGTRILSLSVAVALLAPGDAAAQVSLTTLGVPSTQNFDTLPASGSATWTNNSTIPGWFHARTGTGATVVANNGSSNAGNLYSYGTGTATDRALGSVGSGNAAVGNLFWGIRLQNNSGATITSLDVSYVGEEWRNSAAAAQTVAFSYLVGSPSVTGSLAEFQSAGVAVTGLNFTSPITGGTAGALDGNSAANRVTITASITGLSIPNGTEVMLRWTDPDHTGSDHGLALDDFSVTPNPGGGPVIPNLSINDVTQVEGNSGTTMFTFTVSLSSPAPAGGVSFDITTADGPAGQATQPGDYTQNILPGQTIPLGNTSYPFVVAVNGDTFVEPNETFFVNVTNVVGATLTDGQGLGTINNDDVSISFIHDVQGPGAASPLVGASVSVSGIVTGLKSNGFFVQEEDVDIDANPATSEGILVFTSSAPPPSAAVGNLVQVTGTVTEFVPTQDPLQPPLTEITSPTVVLISTGNPLPTIVPLTTTFPDPLGVHDQLERVEGMLVSVPSLTVSGPTLGSVNEPSATATSTGVFYGVVTGVPRPLREAGIQAPDPAPAGTIPPIPRFDSNPERIRVDSDGLVGGGSALNVGAGTEVTGLAGPLDYSFRTYTILPASTPTVTGGPVATAVTTPLASEFTVAAYNLERFFDPVNDGNGAPVLTSTAFDNRLAKASLGIRDYLKTPDIIGVVEVENLTTLQALATQVNNDAVLAAQPNPIYQAFLVEGNDVGGIDVGFLVKSAIVTGATPRVTVIEVVQELDGTLFTNPNLTTETLNDRPPLRLRAVVNHSNGATFPVTVIVNHLRSLIGANATTPGSNGWATDGDRVRAKRQKQAEDLANLVQARQLADPAERIVLVGDFNAFEFNDGLGDSMNVIAGTPPPDNQTAVGGDGIDLVNPDFTNLASTAPALDRYSFVFDGNAQSLDHVLVNAPLVVSTLARREEHPRINADFPETARNTIVPSVTRLADHDPIVTFFKVAGFASNNALLSNLTLSAGTLAPVFAPATTGYAATVVNAVNSVTATPTAADAGAIIEVRVNGGGFATVPSGTPSAPLALNVGSNTADVRVTAESTLTIQTYSVAIHRCAAISLNGLPNGTVGTAYSGSAAASGGSGSYTYALTSAPGTLPPGLTLNPGTGSLGTTPSATGTFNFQVTATDTASPGTCTGVANYTVHIGSVVAASDLVIREFRLRGPISDLDEYIEIANRTAGPLTIAALDGSMGFGIAAERVGGACADPPLLATIPNGTVIPAGGSFLAANRFSYTLSDYGGVGQALPDSSSAWLAGVCDGSGIGLFRSSTTFTLATVLDAAGFVGSTSPWREGTPLPGGFFGVQQLGQHAFVRKTPYPTGGLKDTGDNAADFHFVAPDAGAYITSPPNTLQSSLGAPGPGNLASPRVVPLPVALADPAVGANSPPNRTQVGNYHYFRRMYTNNTGSPITSLRFRILALSTLWGDGYLPGGIDWRGISTTGVSFVPSPGPASVTAMGLTLEAPSIAYSATGRGGGYNASFTVDLSSLPLSSLANGASIYINIGFRNVKAGSFHFTVVPEIVN